MRDQLLKTTLCAGSLLAASFALPAAPFQRADVAADPAWVVHLDVDALRATGLGQFLQTEMDKPEAQAKLAAFQTIFGVDLRTQLHGLTLYCTGPNPADGVLMVYADFDPAKLVTLAKAALEYDALPYKQHTIHSWLDEKKRNKQGEHPRVYASIQGKRVIFGQRAGSVGKSLDVLDGAVPALASGGAFPELGAANDPNFLEAAARKVDFRSSEPSAALLRLSNQGHLQVKEAQGQVQASLTLEAKDEETAGLMYNVGQGLVSLLKLQEGKPEAAKLANAAALKHDGPRVMATLSMPTGDLVEMAKADAARKAAKKAHAKTGAEEEK